VLDVAGLHRWEHGVAWNIELVAPQAMKREIWRNYPVMEKVELVEGLLDRGILDEGRRVSKQPGRCCMTGCQVPEPPSGQVSVLQSSNSPLDWVPLRRRQ